MRGSDTGRRNSRRESRNVFYGEGFRTPAFCGTVVRALRPAFESLPRRKPRVGRDAVWSGATYGDFRMADSSRMPPRGLVACSLASGIGDGGEVRSRGCAGLARARRSEEDWRPCEDIVSLLRRTAGSNSDRRCEAGCELTEARRQTVGRSAPTHRHRARAPGISLTSRHCLIPMRTWQNSTLKSN